MKKTYIQPEVELISLASMEDFLDASPGSVSTPGSWGGDGVGDNGDGFADDNTGSGRWE